MSQIEKDLKSYIHWCKVLNLVPSEFKNLTIYCHMLKHKRARINMCLSK